MKLFFGQRALALFATLALLAPCAVAQNIVVDGDLTDLLMKAQAEQADPPNDVTPAFISGWDYVHVYVLYNPKMDTLYIGLDLQDSVDHPGVPGDADGDRDPNDTSRLDVPQDQFGVGIDEEYLFQFDTDIDGSFENPNDLAVIYRGNEIRAFNGDGTPHAGGLVLNVALGTRGALVDPGMPNQNRNADDIEVAIRNFSAGDNDPCDWGLCVYAGSLVDALNEDQLDTELIFSFPETLTFNSGIQAAGGGTLDECAQADIGDVLTIEASITNTGAEPLDPVWINHHIPDGLEYIVGSVSGAIEGRRETIGGGVLVRHLRPGGDSGIDPGETETMTFDIRVTSFPSAELAIRGYAEGVLNAETGVCVFSCLERSCVVNGSESSDDDGSGKDPTSFGRARRQLVGPGGLRPAR